MIIVIILRWLCGYFEFSVNGRFPERFLNLASRNGVNLWNMTGEKESIKAKAKIVDAGLISTFARKTGTELTVIREYGLPHLCAKYKERAGLLAGLILGSLLCAYLSGFVWSIRINAPEGINEYEIRSELRELGLYEGIRFDRSDISELEMQLKIKDKRISWLSINEFGTALSVEISPKEEAEKNSDKDKNAVSNLKSTADGTITKIKVRKGKATVQIGDGVRKGQLLVSGIVEYTDGSSLLTDCDGEIYAETSSRIIFELPKNTEILQTDENYIFKREINILGIQIPLSVCGNPDGSYVRTTHNYKLTFGGNDIPVGIKEEVWQKYDKVSTDIKKEEAEKILENRRKLYELFLVGNSEKQILERSENLTETDDSYVLTVNYEIEENICEKSYIEIKDQSADISNSGT